MFHSLRDLFSKKQKEMKVPTHASAKREDMVKRSDKLNTIKEMLSSPQPPAFKE